MEGEMNEQKLIKNLGIRLEQKTIELAEREKQIVMLRQGLINLRKEAEFYGETWARCYVADFDRVAVDSKEARFKLLAAAQDRLKDFADALDATQDLSGLVLCDAEPITLASGVTLNTTKGYIYCATGESFYLRKQP
jgi:hypothetical protein